MPRRRRFKRVLVAAAGCLILYFLVCLRLSSIYLYPGGSSPGPPPAGVREVRIPSRGFEVPTWTGDNLASAETVFVLAHGNGGSRGGLDELIERLQAKGYATVAPAMPGQEASPEHQVGFGPAEARTLEDVVAWTRERARPGARIFLWGVSLGGAAAWIAAPRLRGVDGIVTESAVADFPATVNRFFDRSAPFGAVLLRPVVWLAQARSGLSLRAADPLAGARAWRGRPALVIQAGDDDLVQPWQGRELAQASGADYWEVPGARHARALEADPEEYVRRLEAFVAALPAKKR